MCGKKIYPGTQDKCIRSGGNGVKLFLNAPTRIRLEQDYQTQLLAHLLSKLHNWLVHREVLGSPQHLKIGPLLLPACLLEGK